MATIIDELSPDEALTILRQLAKSYGYVSPEDKAEFKDWVQDVPGECFSYLLREWAQWIQSIKKLYQ